MSVNKNIYVVYGYDLSDYRDELCTEELCESDEFEGWTCNQRRGQVQVFDDPMSGYHLYLGYIAAAFKEGYEDQVYMAAAKDISSFEEMVTKEVETLPAIWREKISETDFNVIVFTEYT